MGSSWTSLWEGGRQWNVEEGERSTPLPCDSLLDIEGAAWHRAVDVDAPPERLFRWLCQLRAAPYSYDWIDNFGRQSPRELTPGLDALELGQSVMTIFELVSFERDRQVTVVLPPSSRWSRRLFGELAVTYAIRPRAGGCRLLGRLLHRPPRGPWGWLVGALLPLGDLVMMRKQFLTLKELAES